MCTIITRVFDGFHVFLCCWMLESHSTLLLAVSKHPAHHHCANKQCQCIFRASFPYISMYSQSDACKPTIVMQRVYGWRRISMAFLPEMVVERSSTGFHFFQSPLYWAGSILWAIFYFIYHVFWFVGVFAMPPACNTLGYCHCFLAWNVKITLTSSIHF